MKTTQTRQTREPKQDKIVVLSNRGPNDFVWRGGSWVVERAAGGLVSMLAPLAQRPDTTWFCCVSEPPDAQGERDGLFTTAADQCAEFDVVPLPLPPEVYQAYYGRISNEVLWMLQHHMLGPGGYELVDHARYRAWSSGYFEANRRLAAAVKETCVAPRAFLVQDYHLYPLPALLRRYFPHVRSLHFTHIPFPEPTVLRLLPKPWREAILHGMLGADRVGFQTEEDREAFLACCKYQAEREVDFETKTVRAVDGRQVYVGVYPASVDPEALLALRESPRVAEARARFADTRSEFSIVRVDRLDPSKNQLVGFKAFAQLLETRPDLHGRVIFRAFLVPSRTDHTVYRDYKTAIYREIDRINEAYGPSCGRPPIEVYYTNDREQALAALERCDVLLVNSKEDGMNLVAKEWAIVADTEHPGVLVVSETAGVAEEAAGSALTVSPLDVEETTQAMVRALEMPRTEREGRLQRFRARVRSWTASHWLTAQLTDLGVE
ncbi:trehalose-6-phosphate synthase [Pendulispora rubella]|uniref:Trehalose-6-phosphate synthase n=1 Tax=Pendulispora rubella TaxID=2741070 RepID=A0ABZ2LBK9_9BACT